MDGNNRWARRRGLPGRKGHEAGEHALQAIVEAAARRGVQALTVFAFSSENWRRPPDEVNALMELFVGALAKRVPELHGNGIRLRFIGDLSAFSPQIRDGIADAERTTAGNDRMHVSVAVNYGGQWDITRAARELAAEAAAGRLLPEQVDESALASRLSLAELPPPDLLIRTGGELRISNFMLWQLAYSELYFTETLWPDFDEAALDEALAAYAARQRRFGRSGAELGQD